MNHFLKNLINRYPELTACLADIQSAFELLRESYRMGGKVLICGNGGSAADSEHIVAELMKGFLTKRPIPTAVRSRVLGVAPADGDYLTNHLQGALPAISLVSQTALISAYANDVAADMVFAQQVYGYGRAGDALIGISTSGNSKNVIYALQVGRALGLHTIGMTGAGGGEAARWCDALICVPEQSTGEIQQLHQAVYHAMCGMLEEEFFPQNDGEG